MKRREFITLLGGAAAMWPLTAWAQQSERCGGLGFSLIAPRDRHHNVTARISYEASAHGWGEGRNVQIDLAGARGMSSDIADTRRN